MQLLHTNLPTAKLAIPKGIPTKEAKTEMETHPVIVEVFKIIESLTNTFVVITH